MVSLAHKSDCRDTRQVMFGGGEITFSAPIVFQEIDSVPHPASMVSNDIVLTATYNASAWFNGIDTLIVDEHGDEVFRYGPVQNSRLKEDSRQKLEGISLLLGSAGAHCYYHWMVDVLPKLGVLESAGVDLSSVDHFILRDLDLPFQIASLEHFGIPKEKIRLSRDIPNLRVELLYNVEIRNFVGMKMNSYIPQFLKSKFLGNVASIRQPEKIYISRPKGVNRPVDNEDEVLELLTANGFRNVVMEGMSLLDQAVLFSNADTIVASHGGALTNIVYSKPDTRVIEMFGAHVFSYYYGLANLCSQAYYAILQDGSQYQLVVDAMKGNSMSNQQVTIRQASPVNVSALRSAIECIGPSLVDSEGSGT